MDATFQGPDELMELLAMQLHRLGAARAAEVVFCSDGAPWIWERLDWVIRRVGLPAERVAKVLDWAHAAHHISLALEALGLAEAERRQVFHELRGWLRQGRARDVITELARRAQALADDSKVCEHLDFLDRHEEAGHLQYLRCRRRHWPRGSGAVESAIRRVINLRLKGNGIMWDPEKAEGMLLMRATALSGRWPERFREVRQAMGVDRRLGWRFQSPDLPRQLKLQLPIAPPQLQAKTHSEDKAPAA